MISRTSWKGRFWLGLETDIGDRILSEVAIAKKTRGVKGAKIKLKQQEKEK